MTLLYRKRLIPDECICLSNDTIIRCNENEIITSWQTLRPKNEFASGFSYYVLDKGWKISKFISKDGELVYTFTDLLADVIIKNDGSVNVVDLDELADALRDNIISKNMMIDALYKLDNLLTCINTGKFQKYLEILDDVEK